MTIFDCWAFSPQQQSMCWTVYGEKYPLLKTDAKSSYRVIHLPTVYFCFQQKAGDPFYVTFSSTQLLVGGWPCPSFLVSLVTWSALEPFRHIRERSPADSHNSTHWPSAAFLALTGAAIDFPSFMQLIGSAHREGVLFGKRAMAAGQENPARAPGASPCQCSHTWHHPSTTLHAQQQRRGSQPMKQSSSAVSGGNSTAKAGFPSCPHIPPLLSEQAHTDLPITCFYLALSPSFLPLHFIVIRKVLKRCKLWKSN